ncbi:MAG: hypothetical protein K9N23_08970 [Akkermansiaceae bacterium]|nr:hypothetical protein [Akkermansiaceae bacterium]
MNNTPMKMKLPILLVLAGCLFVTHLEARVWTSADGTSKTEAQFISEVHEWMFEQVKGEEAEK